MPTPFAFEESANKAAFSVFPLLDSLEIPLMCYSIMYVFLEKAASAPRQVQVN